ncbi:hypothetical protein ACLB1T_11975 [Escherichia coli]
MGPYADLAEGMKVKCTGHTSGSSGWPWPAGPCG